MPAYCGRQVGDLCPAECWLRMGSPARTATDAPTPEDAPALARSRLASWLRDWHRSALGELGEAVSCPPTVLAILGDAAESVDWRVVAGRLLAYREGEGL